MTRSASPGRSPQRPSPRHIRVFLASPGDVWEERKAAIEVLARLPDDPSFRDKITIRTIAWDKEGAGTPMLVGVTPQEAVLRDEPRPSECDIVIVILWSRMGTPFAGDAEGEFIKADGSRYSSGWEWEFEEAMRGFRENGRPQVMLFHRSGTPKVPLDDPEFEAKREQLSRVRSFIAKIKYAGDSARYGVNEYESVEAFKSSFERRIRSVLTVLLDSESGDSGSRDADAPPTTASSDEPPPPAYAKLRAAVLAKAAPIETTKETLAAIRAYRPRDLEQYRLSRIAEWSVPQYAIE